jgi:putative GTP pyrophosphokinase
MPFVTPKFTRSDVDKAGGFLISDNLDFGSFKFAFEVLSNWRACHAYPINTFQATLRKKVISLGKDTIVAQRLKRAPSVIAKLKRFKTMRLSQMQDIGGLRAIVPKHYSVKRLEHDYRNSYFQHELYSSKNYINEPKPDGYRSVHLIYRYLNPRAPEYDGLFIELQIRTRLQHAWATAVETMGTFLGQALKSGQGERKWKNFFTVTSAALSHIEGTAAIPGFQTFSKDEIFDQVATAEKSLHVLTSLSGFSIAADKITTDKGVGKYNLVILDSTNKTVKIRPFAESQLEQANEEYARIEVRAQQGEKVEAVLVSAGPFNELKKAYPNFFLDTRIFVSVIASVIKDR